MFVSCRNPGTKPDALVRELDSLSSDQWRCVHVVPVEHAPDELGLHRVVERHEHLGVLPYLAHHVLQSHKEGKRGRGGKLGLATQVDILLLGLRGRGRERKRERARE